MIIATMADDYSALLRGEETRGYGLPDTPIAPPEIIAMLAGLAETLERDFHPASWLMVEADEIVGLCSLKTAPSDGVVEIGYGVAPSRQGRGVATRAVADVVAWAWGHVEIRTLAAETLPDHRASHRVLIRNGFIHVGERIDEEDGRVFCWRCPTV